MDRSPFREGLSAISNGASILTGWALAMLGATVVGLVGGEYLKPTGVFRCIYLLFLPGWVFLGTSIYYGEKVTRRLAASLFTVDEKQLIKIGAAMNTEYAQQRWFFQLSLLSFGAWLVGLLIWWVFAGDAQKAITGSVAFDQLASTF